VFRSYGALATLDTLCVSRHGMEALVMHTIAVLHVPGCAGGHAALDLASDIARTRSDVKVRDVVIEAEVDAVATGFRGSPTVLIDGRDVELDPQTPVGAMG
jgi:hypothetical protein